VRVAPLLALLVLASPALGAALPPATVAPGALPLALPLPVSDDGPGAAPAVDATVEHLWITSFDGTRLRASWFVPANVTDVPVVLRTHGWGGTRETQVAGMVEAHLGRGYAVLTWDSRGFGESENLTTLNHPDIEARDVSALLDWVAAQPGVRLDAPGDPRAAMGGGSYAGGIQFLAALRDARIDALAPEVTWHDLRHSLAPNGVLKTGWIALLYAAGHAGGHLGTYTSPAEWKPNAHGMDPAITSWLAQGLATNRLPEEAMEGLAARSLAPHLDGLERFPPTMVYAGWHDTLFTPNEAVWTYEALRARGFQACIMVHGGGHGYITPDLAYVRTSILDFLDYWVLETTAPVPPPIEVFQPWDNSWNRLGVWPDGRDRGTTYHFNVIYQAGGVAVPGFQGFLSQDTGWLGGTYPIVAAPAPLGLREVPQFQQEHGFPRVEVPATGALFPSKPFPEPRVLIGTPRLTLTVLGPAPDATLFVELLDLTEDNATVAVLGNQVTPVRIATGAPEVTLDLELTAVSHRFEANHRLGVRISATDSGHGSSRVPLPVLLQADGNTRITIPWADA
jgi:putative CocE/NonD family hydrolase